jgi:formylglycine-generating enzyme required for sulfatase activity
MESMICHAPLTTEQERGLKPKDSFQECENCPEMVVLPVGAFTMGAPEGEAAAKFTMGTQKGEMYQPYNFEGPQHVVTISRPFAAARLHVTVDQFKAFVAETGHQTSSECFTLEEGKWQSAGSAPSSSAAQNSSPSGSSHRAARVLPRSVAPHISLPELLLRT